tara:strand:+ start:3007 stop:3723 length:717 start_codon:yes stop_codon:yes gene_type:complete
MVSRLIVHTKNSFQSLKWIRFNLNNFRKQLESQGYYSISITKFFLWKESAKYFKVFDSTGNCFFVKLQSDDKVRHEYKIFKYLDKHNLSKICFYPKIFLSNIGNFSYNVFEELDGDRINKKIILDHNLIGQMKRIVSFLDNIGLVHRDIRPHNIIVVNDTMKIIDFEHSSINNEIMDNNSTKLNKDFSPNGKIWDDAYSFKKIIDSYINEGLLQENSAYSELKKMVGKNIYEFDKENI